MEQSPVKTSRRRPNFPRDFKIMLVEKALQPGVSIAKLAREHGINDNLLFNWRQLYLRGKLGIKPVTAEINAPGLLAVTLAAEPGRPVMPSSSAGNCTCDIEFAGARLRLSGDLTPALLRTLIQELKGPQP